MVASSQAITSLWPDGQTRFVYSLIKKMIEEYLKKIDLPEYKKRLILEKYSDGKIQSIDHITSLSKTERSLLSKSFKFRILKLHNITKSDNNIKAILETEDGKFIETVLIKEKEHNTVCLSTQIGCPVKCVFCASGHIPYQRNLSDREIVEQYLFWSSQISDSNPNIVFMGMGEPLLNLENVLGSIRFLQLSKRKITISTVGIIEPLKALLSNKNQFRIALSLHSPFQDVREKLIPLAKKNHIEDIINELKIYTQKYNKRITIEYLLLKGINDQKKDADELISLVRQFNPENIFVNLIKYNKTPHCKLEATEINGIFQFSDYLRKKGINNYIRFSKGENKASACGQLACELNLPNQS